MLIANGADLNTLCAAKGSAVYWDGSLADLPESETDSGSGSSSAVIDILCFANGEIRSHQNYLFANTLIGRWDGQITDSSNTEIRFVVFSGAVDGNNAGTFQLLTSNRNFFVAAGPGGGFETSSAQVRVEFQLVGDSSTLITSNVTVVAIYIQF